MRWLWFLPVGMLTVFAGYLGYKAGRVLSESDVIARYASIYVEKHGGDPSDCVARLSDDAAIHMRVTCLNDRGAGILFDVGPRGSLLQTTLIGDNAT